MPKISKIIIPNTITSLNLLSGAISIVLAIQGEVRTAAILILIAAVFDFFDGFVARKINAVSELGKQLDSLADLISFGMAPTAIMYSSLRFSQKVIYGSHFFQQSFVDTLILGLSFLIVIFSAIRLAKFNISTNQKYGFVGLPTPAFAILVASFPLISSLEPENFVWFNIFSYITGISFPFEGTFALMGLQIYIFEKTYFLVAVTIIFSYLLISNIHMFSLKFQTMKFKDNTLRYRFLIFSGILIIFLQSLAIPIIIFTYVIISIFTSRANKYRYLKAKRNMEQFFKPKS